jgi:hypothetical protein
LHSSLESKDIVICQTIFFFAILWICDMARPIKRNSMAFSPKANRTDRAVAIVSEVSASFGGQLVSCGQRNVSRRTLNTRLILVRGSEQRQTFERNLCVHGLQPAYCGSQTYCQERRFGSALPFWIKGKEKKVCDGKVGQFPIPEVIQVRILQVPMHLLA